MIEKEKVDQLLMPLPSWAVKQHPTKSNMSAIHPMAVIDRLNEVFGFGGWHWHTHEIEVTKEIQKTKNGDRSVYMSAVHGTLRIPKYDLTIEQFGGSTNDDKGDALKGGSTDALTKCASYLGIGASIYKGQGNVEPPREVSPEEAFTILLKATTLDELTKAFKSLPVALQKDTEVIAKATEIKNNLQ